jgi:hypothetical protein
MLLLHGSICYNKHLGEVGLSFGLSFGVHLIILLCVGYRAIFARVATVTLNSPS